MEKVKRAFFGSEEYFDRDVARRKKALVEYARALADAREQGGNQALYLYEIFVRQFQRTVSHYSRGDDLEVVRQHFAETLQTLCEYRREKNFKPLDLMDLEQYHYALEVLALCLLFDAPRNWFEAVVVIVEAGRAQDQEDYLIDFLISCWDAEREPSGTCLHPDPFQWLRKAIEADHDEDRLLHLLQFLQVYRHDTASLPWSESHMTDDGAFFGFWSFTLAAVVREMGISDEAFAANMLYPEDMVAREKVAPGKPEKVEVPPVEIPEPKTDSLPDSLAI
ncbi:DUF1911 domain-containing protein [Sulfidibacter corallicola]|uniref:DUF1911 domain-containing protein n=1 Tax=Sulfidibacter corallicola TaxID=2818388 RepID=A0A8A4TT05_SULCO|nr:PoNe immunity protein domain-containing protein [Sulfidibacter corallicola]QTD52294.1 DUF1911 domain-containing protein [Sulfidibacter corallicola]